MSVGSFFTIDLESLLSILSVGFAGLALYFTGKQSQEQVRHNKAMLRPFLIFHIEALPYKNLMHFRLIIKNIGFGPAIIDEQIVKCEGENILIPDLGYKYFGHYKNSKFLGYSIVEDEKTGIAPNTDVLLADYRFEAVEPMSTSEIVSSFQDTYFEIKYTSLDEKEQYQLKIDLGKLNNISP